MGTSNREQAITAREAAIRAAMAGQDDDPTLSDRQVEQCANLLTLGKTPPQAAAS